MIALLAALALAATCDEKQHCCDEWGLPLLDAHGKQWGLITADSPAALTEKLQHEQQSERAYCEWLGKRSPCSELGYERPGKPRCTKPREGPPAAIDMCSSDFGARVAALEAHANEQTARLKRNVPLLEGLRAGAEAVSGTAGGAPLLATASYGVALNDALSKVQRLRETLKANCAGETAEATERLFGPHTGTFGGHAERNQAQAELAAEIEDAERAVNASLPSFEPQSLDVKQGTVHLKKRTGTGRIILGSEGPFFEGRTAARSGALAYVYVGKRGVLHFAPVTVVQTDNGLLLLGRGEDQSETLELTHDPDADADGVVDAEDLCPHDSGPRENKGCPPPKPQQQVVAQAPRQGPVAPRDIGSCAEPQFRLPIGDQPDDRYCWNVYRKQRCRVFDTPGGNTLEGDFAQTHACFATLGPGNNYSMCCGP